MVWHILESAVPAASLKLALYKSSGKLSPSCTLGFPVKNPGCVQHSMFTALSRFLLLSRSLTSAHFPVTADNALCETAMQRT